MTATARLGLLLKLMPPETAAVETRVFHDDAERERSASKAPTCQCGPDSWGDVAEHRCARCGHDLEAARP